MTRVVKKFGGKTLQTEERIKRAVEEVAVDIEKGNSVISVVSAMGREGDPYATDTLIGLMEEVSPDIDPLKKDLLMSCGEVVSASLFSHYLDREGYDSVPVTGSQAGILTDREFGDAEIIDVDTTRVEDYMARARSVVLAGFQGRTKKGEITTLGRGGSDTTALRIGGELGAEFVEIFTDVPGVAVVDPDLVDNPPFFSNIPRRVLVKLAENGAEVIHPRAVSTAREYDVPFSIKCFWGDGKETKVGEKGSSDETPLGVAVTRDCDLIKGTDSELKDIAGPDSELIKDRGKGSGSSSYLLRKKNGLDLSGYENRSVSVVSAVPTIPDSSMEIINKTLTGVSNSIYIKAKATPEEVKFIVEPEGTTRITYEIYDLFY